VPPFVSHFEFGPSHVPLSTDHDQSDLVVAFQVGSEQRPSDSSSLCQETSPLPFARDHDDDVSLLKSHFDPGGPEVPVRVGEPRAEGTDPVSTVDDLPEHVTQLFLDTLVPVEATYGLKQLLIDHRHTFATSSVDIGFCSIIQHDIDTGDATPIRQAPRKPPLAARDAEDEILNEMLKTGVIEPSMSSWASPVCLVRKKNNTFRFCIDYRRVNAISKKDAYPIPDIQDALDHLRASKYFATFDMLSGYWQLD